MSCGAPSREARLQITDLICQVAELQGRQNASADMEWKVDDLERRLDEVRDAVTHLLIENEKLYWPDD
jgi:hypothetical protein